VSAGVFKYEADAIVGYRLETNILGVPRDVSKGSFSVTLTARRSLPVLPN
jgi:hypothetical protein